MYFPLGILFSPAGRTGAALRRRARYREEREHNERSATIRRDFRTLTNIWNAHLRRIYTPGMCLDKRRKSIIRARENKLALSAAIGMTNYTVRRAVGAGWGGVGGGRKGSGAFCLTVLTLPSRKLSPAICHTKRQSRAAQFAHCVNCIKSLSDIWAERRGGRANRKPKICTLIR